MEKVEGVPVWGWVLVAMAGATSLVIMISWLTSERAFNVVDKVVVITGGSSGIGRATAEYALLNGAHVAILARKADLLREAETYLRTVSARCANKYPNLRITTHAVDVGNDEATRRVFAEIAAAHGGRVDVLVNSAGISLPKTFEETSVAEFQNVLHVNVIGTRNATHSALPYMRNGGRIVFVSSQAGQVGIYGYTAYSASKFALQGFAQALQQEVWQRNIRVSLCFPPDTDTPMLHEENKSKPHITMKLSQSTSTVGPDKVARGILNGIIHWQPQISLGFDGWMLSVLTSGMGPAGSLVQGVIHVITIGLWRLVALIILRDFYSTIEKHDKPAPSDKFPADLRNASAAKDLAAPLVEDAKRK